MTALPISTTIVACLAVIMFPLSLHVTMRRIALGKTMGDPAGVAFGDGDDEVLRRRIRAFGNFIEYVPICLLLLILVEYNGASSTFIWIVGVMLILGRITHALGTLYATTPAPRGIGMLMTHAAYLVPSVWLLRTAWT